MTDHADQQAPIEADAVPPLADASKAEEPPKRGRAAAPGGAAAKLLPFLRASDEDWAASPRMGRFGQSRAAGPGLGGASFAVRRPPWIVRHGFEAAGLAIALGTGWLLGANTFDRSRQIAALAQHDDAVDSRLAALDGQLAASPSAIEALRRKIESVEAQVQAQTRSAKVVAERAASTSALADISARLDRMATLVQDQSGRAEKVAALVQDQSARIDKMADHIDRLERQAADLPTGSIPAVPPPKPKAPAAASASVAPAPVPRARAPAIIAAASEAGYSAAEFPLHGYALRDVVDGSAIVESRDGLRSVREGDVLPGAGRVEAIERRGRRWVVVTSIGVIDADMY